MYQIVTLQIRQLRKSFVANRAEYMYKIRSNEKEMELYTCQVLSYQSYASDKDYISLSTRDCK